MNENEFSQSPESFNDQDILDQIADLMGEIDAKQAVMDANVIDQANAAVEGKINSAEVADILEEKALVVFETVFERLKEINQERGAARAETFKALDADDEEAARKIDTLPDEDERHEARRIAANISNFLDQKSSMPAPDRERRLRVILQDIQEFLEMRQGK